MTSLLIVDDEERVLDALHRGLRTMRPKWELEFVSSGNDALRYMAERHFDVLVSDMDMPGMNGATLLQKAAQVAPDTRRIGISGRYDALTAYSLTTCSHMFLGKPFNISTFVEFVVEAMGRQDMKPDTAMRTVRAEILSDLPREEQRRINRQRLRQVGISLSEDSTEPAPTGQRPRRR